MLASQHRQPDLGVSCFHFIFSQKTIYYTVGPKTVADFVFSTCLALFADHNACPQLFADFVFQYPAKKIPCNSQCMIYLRVLLSYRLRLLELWFTM